MNLTIFVAGAEAGAPLLASANAAGHEAVLRNCWTEIPATQAVAFDGFAASEVMEHVGRLGLRDAIVLVGVDASSSPDVKNMEAVADGIYPRGDGNGLVFALAVAEARRAGGDVRISDASRLEQANDTIYTIDFEGCFTWANAAAESLTGYSRRQLIGMSLTELVVPEDLDVVREQRAAKLTGSAESTIFELSIRRADGEIRNLEVSSRLLYENGAPIGIQGIARDITEVRALQTELARFGAIVESAGFAVIGRDLDGRVTSWNAAAERMFGWSRAEAVGHTMNRIAPPGLHTEVAEQFRDVASGGSLLAESNRVRKDGSSFPVRATAFAIRDPQGRITGTASLVYDITDELAAREALADSEKRYRAAADLSPDAYFILGLVADSEGQPHFIVSDMNQAARALLGIAGETPASPSLESIAPGVEATELFENLVRVARTGMSEQFETFAASGPFAARWLDVSAVKLGTGVAVTLRDTTRARREHLELMTTEAQLRAVFESANDAVLVLDPSLRLIKANAPARAFARTFFGSEPAEGDSVRPWVTADEWRDFQAYCERALEGERVFIEWRRSALDGTQVWLESSYSPVRDATGATIGIAFVGREITERRRMEREIAEREAALSAVFASINEAITLIDPEMRFILGNELAVDRARAFTGNTPRAGGHMHEYVREEDWRTFDDLFLRALSGEHVTASGRFDDPMTGEPRWTEYSYLPVLDAHGETVAVARVSRDVTQARLAERALREANRNQQAFFENTPDSLFVLDVEETAEGRVFRVVMVNSAFCSLTGLQAERIQGRLVDDFMRPVDVLHAAIARYEQAIAAGRTIEYEETVPYGSRPQIQTILTPLIDARGRCYRLIGTSRDISERLRLQQEERRARQEAEGLALIVESANDAILSLDMEMRITYWNPGAVAVYGFSADEAVGRHISVIYPEDQASAEVAQERLTEVYAGAAFVGSPTQRRHKDGRILDVLISAFPLRDAAGDIIGVASTATDMTERLKAEAAARTGLADLDAVFASSRDSLILIDTDGMVIRINPAARRSLHVARGPVALEGRPWVEVMPESGKAEFRAHFAAALAGNTVSFERQIALDGESRWFDVAYAPVLLEDGTVRGVLITARDVTERRRTNEALLQAQKLESLAVLAGGIAHDFNNLLVGILGNAGLALVELPPSSPARPTIEAIELAGQRAAELARQMLAYSGRGKLVIQDSDVNSLVEEMTHLLRVSIGRRISLRLDLVSGIPLVKADATQLRQVVMNLVVNASDAIGDQEGTIAVATGTLEATAEILSQQYFAPDLKPGKYVTIEVTDTGAGMDAATIARIFDPFFTTKFTGRGLGLAAVLGIMRSHNGAIKVESTPGEGTTFRLLLPAILSEVSAMAPSEKPAPWTGSGTVLVVDDEPTVRAVTVRALRAFGFDAIEAEDGAAGLELFAANRDRIVAVLLDMTMPRMNGEEAFAELRKLDPNVRIILMSGYTEQDATGRGMGEGLTGFIQKPYELSTLRSALQSALQPPPES